MALIYEIKTDERKLAVELQLDSIIWLASKYVAKYYIL